MRSVPDVLAPFVLFLSLAQAAPPVPAAPAAAADDQGTLLLQEPDVSADAVVFVYARDLWIAGRDGGDARRLTSSTGEEHAPCFSPDGRWIAFTGQYDGNSDVYVVPVEGGVPRRLTWHPGGDAVQGWNPDGKHVLFTSGRATGVGGARLFQVGLEGGTPEPLELPKVARADWHRSGTRIAYTPIADAFRTWKRYRGGRLPPVWIFDVKSHDVVQVPHVRASDTFPCWVGDDVYFASDRDGHMNVWRFKAGAADVEQMTHFTDFDVRNMGSNDDTVVFEQAGALHLLDAKTGAVTRLVIHARADFADAMPRWKKVGDDVRDADVAPNGKRVVFEARGEIFTVPREHGDSRNLSGSPGVHDRSPVWSPDGKQIAWFQDADGEYKLVVAPQDGVGERRVYDLQDPDRVRDRGGFYSNPAFSPDGKHVLFTDKTNRVAFVTLEDGKLTTVARVQGALGEARPTARWSPDSKWIAFQQRNPRTLYDRIALYEVASGGVTPVTDTFGAASEPTFSRDGKLLYFAASVDSGPRLFGLDMSTSASRNEESNLYCVVLQKDGKNPFAPKSDEAVGGDDDKDGKADKHDKKDKKDGDDDKEDGDEPADDSDAGDKHDAPGDAEDSAAKDAKDGKDGKDEGKADKDKKDKKKDLPPIDLEGIDQRVLALPLPSGNYGRLAHSKDKFLFVQFEDGGPKLKRFDFDKRSAETVTDGAFDVIVSGDGKSLLVRGRGGWTLMSDTGGDKKSVKTDDLRALTDTAEEWNETLREVWRIERDYFYDPNMHGVDWPAMWERWSPFLAHVKHRADLNVVIGELIGELCCGHEYVSGGEMPDGPDGVPVGLLGADWTQESGRHRIAHVYRGQNWNPNLRAPLTEPGVDAAEGDYLIQVNGVDVSGSENLYRYFENTAGKQVKLTLSRNADGSEPRTTTVVPLSSESELRRRSWVEDNRRRVEEASGGRLGYIYMPNTGGPGREAFDRDFYSQLDKEGLVLDERYNGGGQVADYVIEVLSRTPRCHWMNREQWVAQSPFAAFEGPKVMVINEYAGSGGDCMPWFFKNAKVGTLVGTRTWGGLVGISGYPPLMDGGSVTAASFGVMDTEGNWAVENVGVSPDIEVIEWPKDIIEKGADPQLDRAIQAALDELAKRPKRHPIEYKPPTPR